MLAMFELLSGDDNALNAGMEATAGALKAAGGSVQVCGFCKAEDCCLLPR